MVDSSVSFRIWIRRSAVADAPYSLRFEVFDGKGILRVARPGILIDPPARVSGFEEALTGDQLRASRFLHVWGAGRKRQSHILTRLADKTLEALPVDDWQELRVDADGGYRYLQLEAVPFDRDAAAPTPEERTGRPRASEEITALGRNAAPGRRGDPPSRDPHGGFPSEPTMPITLPIAITPAQPPEQPARSADPFEGMAASTVLVRILRRQLDDAKIENTVLNARLSALEASARRGS